MVKDFLTLRFRKVSSSIILIFSIHVKFLDLLFLDKFMTVSLALLPPLPTISLSSVLNAFEAKFDNPVVFNREISYTVILLKP